MNYRKKNRMTDNTNKLNADVEVLYLEIEERERWRQREK